MKTLTLFCTLLLPLCASAECRGQGNIHLIPPASTVYCLENGRIVWAVTYSFAWNLAIVEDNKGRRFWDFPLTVNTVNTDLAAVTRNQKTKAYRYQVIFGEKFTKPDSQGSWIDVQLLGNP